MDFTKLKCIRSIRITLFSRHRTVSWNIHGYHSRTNHLAKFQKRIVQILHLIREDKVIVYIDEILIATDSVELNLKTLYETLLKLKQYGFELNLKKCQFLCKKIEYLGYMVSQDGITISERHTSAREFSQPRNIHEIQTFLVNRLFSEIYR